MSVSITVNDPTPAECTALILYLQSMGGVSTQNVTNIVNQSTYAAGVAAHNKIVADQAASPVKRDPFEKTYDNTAEQIAQAVADKAQAGGIVEIPHEITCTIIGKDMTPVVINEPLTLTDVPSFMDAPTTPQFGDTIDDIAGVETLATAVPVIDTAAIFGGTVPPAPLFVQAVQSGTIPADAVITTNTAPADGIERDIHGLPWDARIHAATKARLQDGSWRQRRGVEPGLVISVEAELRGIIAAPAVHVAAPAPAYVAPNVATFVPPAPVVAAPAPDAPKPVNPFAAFMQFMTPLITGKLITTPQLGSICVSLGLPHAGALAQRHDLIPAVQARVQAILDGGAA